MMKFHARNPTQMLQDDLISKFYLLVFFTNGSQITSGIDGFLV